MASGAGDEAAGEGGVNYYPRYLGDYQRKTGHLSLTEHGVYSVLLDHYYGLRKPLPADIDRIYRICRAITQAEQRAVDTVVAEFFPVGIDGMHHNTRCDEEIAKWEVMAERNREVGKTGGRPKKRAADSHSGNPDETRMVSETKPSGNPNGNHGGSENGGFENPDETHGITHEKPSPTPTPTPESRSQHQNQSEKENGRATAREIDPDHDPQNHEGWLRVRAAYPPHIHPEADWLIAEREASMRVAEGDAPWSELEAGCARLCRQQVAKGNVSGGSANEYVPSPKGMFTRREKRWRDPYPLPAAKSEQRLSGNVAAAAEAKRRLAGGGS